MTLEVTRHYGLVNIYTYQDSGRSAVFSTNNFNSDFTFFLFFLRVMSVLLCYIKTSQSVTVLLEMSNCLIKI